MYGRSESQKTLSFSVELNLKHSIMMPTWPLSVQRLHAGHFRLMPDASDFHSHQKQLKISQNRFGRKQLRNGELEQGKVLD